MYFSVLSQKQMKIIGIDLAWQSRNNTTALTVGELSGSDFHIRHISKPLRGLDSIIDAIDKEDDVQGISIDASLIINNESGQRECERELSKVYGSRYASCHASNTMLYPNPDSVALANHLSNKQFRHLGNPAKEKWQIECYPHPALIEIFSLPERLPYKKGKVAARRQGQIELANRLKSLTHSNVLSLSIDDAFKSHLDETHIETLRGKALKQNEDALDSIICAYIGALYKVRVPHQTFGDINTGYIYVPQQLCT